MNLRSIACTLCILSSAAIMRAQTAQDKQTAKQLFDKAPSETDQAQQVRDLCKAAELDPKTKAYSDACNSQKLGLLNSDRRSLQQEKDAFAKNDWAKTITFAKYVSSFDTGLSGEAQDMAKQAKDAQNAANNPKPVTPAPAPTPVDQSLMLLGKANDAWRSGDFYNAETDARAVTNPNSKDDANLILGNIDQYNNYISKGQQLEATNPQAAQAQYNLAAALNPKGPGSPAAAAERLQAVIDAKKPQAVTQPPPPPTPQVVTTTPKPSTPATPKPQDDSAKVAELLTEAQRAESDGKLPVALVRYQNMLTIQPANADASAGVTRVQQKISSDPQQLKLTLVGAIRDFYDSKLSDAKAALGFYLNAPQTRSAGAAYFYLGATLLEQSLLRTPQAKTPAAATVPAEVSTNFQKARAAGYKPLPQYVSPVLMKAWNSAGS